jgi:hypothetical protein
MAGSHGDSDLIATIYDAIIEPSGWDEVVKRIVEATKSFSGNLVLQQTDAGNLTALYNVDPLYADAYAQTYYKDDPLNTPAWSIAPGECGLARTPTPIASEPRHITMNLFAHKDGSISSLLVLRARPMRFHFWLLQDRPMRFGWSLRNGISWKPSRHICSARRRSMISCPGRKQQPSRSARRSRPPVSPFSF